MMNNMFSMFDPSSSYNSSSWMIMLLPLLVIMMKSTMKMKKMIKTIHQSINKEMSQLMGNNKNKFSSNMMTNMFLMIMIMNMCALAPFNFTTSAHISITMTMSLMLWLSIILWGWVNSFKKMMVHLTPMGTPNALMNFMVIIEMVSNLIRPITLSVRLSANMVAGHLLMSLLSNFSLMSYNNSMMSIMFMMILTTLEMMVAMVQAYVLTTLLTLYHNESM